MADSLIQSEEIPVIPNIISTISTLLQRIADQNDNLTFSRPPLSAASFCALEKPQISIKSYLERIFKFANCSTSCFVVAYIYLDRFLCFHPSFAIDSFSVHRVLITAVLTSVKFMEDRCYNNAYFARVGGISLDEMNYLEVDFLFGLRFKLNVTPIMYASYCSFLENPGIPPRLHCSPSEEESSSCNQQPQLTV